MKLFRLILSCARKMRLCRAGITPLRDSLREYSRG